MNDTIDMKKRAIPPMPGGGSWTFNEEQWMWISNDLATAQEPAAAGQAEAGNEPAATATEQE